MCTLLTDRMRDAGRAAAVRHLRFPKAGHALFPYPRPPDEAPVAMQVDFGGSDGSADAAHQAAWPEVVRHLRAA
jgi:hypothetical protein